MAPRRRDWDALSPAYRKRLSGAGVTRTAYESGVDLRKARGKAPAKNATRSPKGSATNGGTGRNASGGGRRVSTSPTTTRRTRRDWDTLTAAYRRRLERAGITRDQYTAGADLRKARGHAFRTPTPSGFPNDSQQRVINGQSTADDRRRVAAWRQSASYPSWLPRDPADLDDQTAVILSTIRPYPNAVDRAGRRAGWRDVQFTYLPDGTVTMRVTPLRGYPFEVTLPDSDAAGQVKSILRRLNTPGIDIDNKGEGYTRPAPRSAPKTPRPPITPAQPKQTTPTPANTTNPAKKSSSTVPAKTPAKSPKTPAQKPAKKPARTNQPTTRKRSASTTRKPSTTPPPNLLDLLYDTVAEAIDTATDVIDAVIDGL